MAKISAKVRRELVQAVGERYRTVSREEKRRILDEFEAVTGYHRKHAIRILHHASLRAPVTERKADRARVYNEAVRQALLVLWEASDRVCGKRLRPLLPTLLPALERHGHLHLDVTVRARLLEASAATIDRLLRTARASAGGRRSRKKRTAAQQSVPVRTFADWKEPEPGYLEVDLVCHAGESMAGSFVHTLCLTDVASGWTECVALLVREGALIVDALERLRTTMPFPLRGIDSDNGTEFMNDTLIDYCAKHNVKNTRSRPYRKNDQAWVEQKNGSVVRRMVGYGRLEGLVAAEALSRLY
ncbi:hypothetical protein [Pendulispora albinea]|uniref:Integrase catalytic domain-containing protein n=1 Tax=Pendulispora albinea TaxID=2741071 RepID=A0ABZ2LVP4_9BACT